MDCHKAGEYMMKYMDKTLTEAEQRLLRGHVDECAACKEDYLIYEEIGAEFDNMELTEAPEGFCEAVMEKIRALPAKALLPDFDGIVFWVCGIFSVLIGIGFIITMNKDIMLQYIAANPSMSYIMDYITPLYAYMAELSASVSASAQEVLSSAGQYLSGLRYVLLAICGGLALTQFAVYKRQNLKNKVGA